MINQFDYFKEEDRLGLTLKRKKKCSGREEVQLKCRSVYHLFQISMSLAEQRVKAGAM